MPHTHGGWSLELAHTLKDWGHMDGFFAKDFAKNHSMNQLEAHPTNNITRYVYHTKFITH